MIINSQIYSAILTVNFSNVVTLETSNDSIIKHFILIVSVVVRKMAHADDSKDPFFLCPGLIFIGHPVSPVEVRVLFSVAGETFLYTHVM